MLGLQRLCLDQHALMHGVRAGDLVDVPGFDQFGLEGQCGEIGDFQTLGRVARHQHFFDPAPRIVECCAHRVQAIKSHQAVGCVFAGRHRLAWLECRRAAAFLVAKGAAQLGVVGVFRGVGIVAHGRLL